MNEESLSSKIIKSRYFLLFGIMLCLCCSLVFSQGVKAESMPYCVEIPRDDFPVRSQPLPDASVIISMDKGLLLYPDSTSGDWYKVPFKDGVFGYVHKNFVNALEAKGSVSVFPGAALKSEMAASSSTLSICSKNTEIAISSVDGDWCKVVPFGTTTTGYMLKSNVTSVGKVLYGITSGGGGEVGGGSGNGILSVTAASANLRADAGTGYAVVANVSSGNQLTNLSSKTGTDGYNWYYVKTAAGVLGYIRSDLVSAITVGGGLSGKTIVIDPGHGSYKSSSASSFDSGAVGPSRVKEKDITLKIALYLKNYLEADGARVIMTRTGDMGVLTLSQRAGIANSANAALFISIHCNSSTSSSAHGTETFYSLVNKNDASINGSLLAARKSAAESVQSNLVGQISRANRGVKTSNFTVITNTNMVSMLMETAFISNPTEERLLNSESFQDKAAKGAYLGIRGYFN